MTVKTPEGIRADPWFIAEKTFLAEEGDDPERLATLLRMGRADLEMAYAEATGRGRRTDNTLGGRPL